MRLAATEPARRILIVDDERDNRELLAIILLREGYVLQTASSGEEALANLTAQAPDLILLDIMMPGMDGYEVAARLKADPATKDIPFLMVTAMDDRSVRSLAGSVGAEGVLTKPIDRFLLCSVVRTALRLEPCEDCAAASAPRGT